MIRKLFLSLAAVAVALSIGCEKSGSGNGSSSGSSGGSSSGGGNNSSAVGVWRCFRYEYNNDGATGSNMSWIFNADGTFCIAKDSTSWQGTRTGTYKVSGNTITGSGTNANEGGAKFDIKFTINGSQITGDFIEHWGPGKTIQIGANKL